MSTRGANREAITKRRSLGKLEMTIREEIAEGKGSANPPTVGANREAITMRRSLDKLEMTIRKETAEGRRSANPPTNECLG